eukprot:5741997-Pyramimonas_sp.AAC.1
MRACKRIFFEPSRGSLHIVSRSLLAASNFNILGVVFGCNMITTYAVQGSAGECGWRLQSLMRTRRFHTDAELVWLFSARILSFIECRTCAFTHASNSVLASFGSRSKLTSPRCGHL